jgi:serine/threonine protein kinase
VEIPSTLPPLIGNLIKNLLEKNPATRPSAEELLNLPELKEAANTLGKLI